MCTENVMESILESSKVTKRTRIDTATSRWISERHGMRVEDECNKQRITFNGQLNFSHEGYLRCSVWTREGKIQEFSPLLYQFRANKLQTTRPILALRIIKKKQYLN
jgi:hypothetical protein